IASFVFDDDDLGRSVLAHALHDVGDHSDDVDAVSDADRPEKLEALVGGDEPALAQMQRLPQIDGESKSDGKGEGRDDASVPRLHRRPIVEMNRIVDA